MTESQKSGIVMSAAHGWNASPRVLVVCVARLDAMVG